LVLFSTLRPVEKRTNKISQEYVVRPWLSLLRMREMMSWLVPAATTLSDEWNVK
jgi:hypothetical protein